MLADLLIFVIVGAFPLFLEKLGVIDSLSVPLGVVAFKVSPATVGFFVLAACRANIT